MLLRKHAACGQRVTFAADLETAGQRYRQTAAEIQAAKDSKMTKQMSKQDSEAAAAKLQTEAPAK